MRYLYTAICYLCVPFVIARLLWRSRKNPGYRQRLAERFGFIPKTLPQHCLWVHAVSVGETLAAAPIVKGFQKLHPEIPIVITTMTLNGAKQVATTFGQTVQHVYVPYDLPDAIARFLNQVQPRLLLIIETELWPNLFYACQQRKIPLFIANARLSEKSAAKYARFPAVVKPMLQAVTLVAVQTQIEAERFIALGLPADRIQVTGTVKFDIVVSEELIQRGKQLRAQCGVERPVWIAGSTHAGEEEIVLAAFALIRKQIPGALLLLIPRHPERAKDVHTLCTKANYQVIRYTENQPITAATDIYLTDVIGQLLTQYAAADVAFVGGSFVPVGGHNVLEPAVLGLPVLTGPHMFNFVESEQLLSKAGALWQINNAEQLANKMVELLQNPAQRQQAGTAGQQVIEKNRGAVEKHMRILESLVAST